MLSITEVPVADILAYISSQDRIIPSNHENAYKLAEELILSGRLRYIPDSINCWLIAYNYENNISQIYKASTILRATDIDLRNLTNHFSLQNINKVNLIRILGYLRHLDNDMNIFGLLSETILMKIFSYIKDEILIALCTTSNKFYKIYQKNLSNKVFHNKLDVSAGDDFSLILNNGQVYSCGNNKYGQLGLGDFNDRNIPTLIVNIIDIVQISCGVNHSLLLTNNGKLYSFGYDWNGNLGLGFPLDFMFNDPSRPNIPRPVLVHDIGNNINQISAGYDISSILMNDGTVYYFGLIEICDIYRVNKPTLIPNLNNIIQVSADTSFLFLSSLGHVYSVGNNPLKTSGSNDRITIPTIIPNLNNIIQISMSSGSALALTNDGKVYGWGSYLLCQLKLDIERPDSPILINKLNNIIRISAGWMNSSFLRSDGVTLISGFSERCTLTRIKQINVICASHSYAHSLFLKNNGQIYVFGSNEYGELGLGDKIDREKLVLLHNLYNIPRKQLIKNSNDQQMFNNPQIIKQPDNKQTIKHSVTNQPSKQIIDNQQTVKQPNVKQSNVKQSNVKQSNVKQPNVNQPIKQMINDQPTITKPITNIQTISQSINNQQINNQQTNKQQTNKQQVTKQIINNQPTIKKSVINPQTISQSVDNQQINSNDTRHIKINMTPKLCTNYDYINIPIMNTCHNQSTISRSDLKTPKQSLNWNETSNQTSIDKLNINNPAIKVIEQHIICDLQVNNASDNNQNVNTMHISNNLQISNNQQIFIDQKVSINQKTYIDRQISTNQHISSDRPPTNLCYPNVAFPGKRATSRTFPI